MLSSALAVTVTAVFGTFVLPPAAEGDFRRALQVGSADAGDGLRISVAIDKDVAQVTATDADGQKILVADLVHPSKAPKGAATAAGVAMLDTPGPVPAGAKAAVLARLAKAPKPVTWQEADDKAKSPSPNPESPDAAKQDLAKHEKAHERFHRALFHIADGTLDKARAELRELDLDLTAGTLVEMAVLARRAEDLDLMGEALQAAAGKQPTAADEAIIALVQDGKDPGGDAVLARMDGLEPKLVCDFAAVASALRGLGFVDSSAAVATAVVDKAPKCIEGYEEALEILAVAGRLEERVALADAAAKRFPGDPRMGFVLATVWRDANRLKDASEAFLPIAMADPTDNNTIRMLLSALLQDEPRREEWRTRLKAMRDAQPDHPLPKFLLGVFHHYENAFEESNRILAPLEKDLATQSRLHVYLAMNDFNLGKREAALERLNKALAMDLEVLPDPDLYYCRAEILRDTDRQQAIDDLKVYLVKPEGGAMSNPTKEARVRQMVADLEQCLKDGTEVCESAWEHPRLRMQQAVGEDDPDPPGPWYTDTKVYIYVGGLLVLLGAVAAIRRRRTA